MGIINATSAPSAIASPWKVVSTNVSGLSTDNMDSVSNGDFQLLTYHVVVHSGINDFYTSFDLRVLNNGGSYKETITNKIRSGANNFQVNAINNAGTLEVQVINNNAFDVQIDFARLVLGG